MMTLTMIVRGVPQGDQTIGLQRRLATHPGHPMIYHPPVLKETFPPVRVTRMIVTPVLPQPHSQGKATMVEALIGPVAAIQNLLVPPTDFRHQLALAPTTAVAFPNLNFPPQVNCFSCYTILMHLWRDFSIPRHSPCRLSQSLSYPV